MPDPNAHTALGIGAGYLVGTVAGLGSDYLVIGAVAALIAAGRQAPEPFAGEISKVRQMVMAVSNISGVSFFSAASTSIIVSQIQWTQALGIPVAALLGFFGYPLIVSITEIINKAYGLISAKIGGGRG